KVVQAADLRAAHLPGGLLDGEAFEDLAHLVDFAEVLGRGRPHGAAQPRNAVDQPLAGELVDGLPERNPADPELLGEGDFPQPVSRPDRAAEQMPAQLPVRLFFLRHGLPLYSRYTLYTIESSIISRPGPAYSLATAPDGGENVPRLPRSSTWA